MLKLWITGILSMCLLATAAAADITNITQGTTHPTIQEAINTSVHGDEIVVDPGEYFENLNMLGMAITLRSQDPTDPEIVVGTVINGGGTGTVITCSNGETLDTVVTGFVITGGNDLFGGMFIESSSPTVNYCTFQGNTGEFGGGMHLHESSALVAHCTFINNVAWIGGGMHIDSSDPSIVDCAFFHNSAPTASGGGMMIENNSSPAITDCAFENNTAQDDGGGIALKVGCNPTISGCSFRHNAAATGGGVFMLGGSSPLLTDCFLINNTSAYSGGGIYILGDGSTPTLKDAVVCANSPDQIDGQFTDDGGNLISPYAPPPASPTADCPQDIDGDGVVGQSDLGMLLAMYGQTCP